MTPEVGLLGLHGALISFSSPARIVRTACGRKSIQQPRGWEGSNVVACSPRAPVPIVAQHKRTHCSAVTLLLLVWSRSEERHSGTTAEYKPPRREASLGPKTRLPAVLANRFTTLLDAGN
jgi:hypothetical protein